MSKVKQIIELWDRLRLSGVLVRACHRAVATQLGVTNKEIDAALLRRSEFFWNGLARGDRVITLIQTTGETANGDEVIYSTNSPAIVDSIDYFGACQGHGITVTIGESDRTIVNSFDDRDVKELGFVPLQKMVA